MGRLADALKQADLAALREALASCGFRDPAKAARNLLAVHAQYPGGLRDDQADPLLSSLCETADADMALNHLERFAAALSDPPALAALLNDPPRLKIYLALFGSSQSLSTYASAYPEETLAWLTPSILNRPLTKEALAQELTAAQEATSPSAGKSGFEAAFAPLRHFRHRALIRIALRDVLGLATLSEITQEIAFLADVALDAACRLAWDALVRQHGPPLYPDTEGRPQPCRFTVLAMGKLGGEELNFSSDIDLLFLYTTEKGETAPES
ncbi:MAG: hypothetical protein HZA23_07900, partial [Nitrospirae bacterium]|nr:hypothetical protein [Nitrospirota bacterium]